MPMALFSCLFASEEEGKVMFCTVLFTEIPEKYVSGGIGGKLKNVTWKYQGHAQFLDTGSVHGQAHG